MGKIHKTRKQKPGYNTYKTVMALRLASREVGVVATELGDKVGCSTAAALSTLKYLMDAGECAVRFTEKGEDGEYLTSLGRRTCFFSDVYTDITPGDFMRIPESAQQNIDPPELYKDAVIQEVLSVQRGMIAQYPVSIFGDTGLFISRIIASVCNDITRGINEIT